MSKPTDRSPSSGISRPVFAGDIPAVCEWSDGEFLYRHRVAWGDCDPAQIAYTANIPGWGLLAIEDWYRACIGYDWYTLNLELGIGTPFVALAFDFVSPVRPPAQLEIVVHVLKTGNTSIRHRVEAYQQDTLCFTGETVAAFVDATTMKPIPVPTNIRATIDSYIAVQDHEYSN